MGLPLSEGCAVVQQGLLSCLCFRPVDKCVPSAAAQGGEHTATTGFMVYLNAYIQHLA